MAHIEKRVSSKGKLTYRVQIRKQGHPPVSATFDRKTAVQKWAQDTESAIREPRDKLAADGLSPATINRYLATLSHALSSAIKENGWLDRNPVSNVSKLKEENERIRFLSDDSQDQHGNVIEGERTRLLRECKRSRTACLYPIVVLALSTGMRKGEILGLTWDDVSFDQRRIMLHRTKNGERRGVPLVGHALDLLREHSKVRRIDSNLVFPGSDADSVADFRGAWEEALKRAGVENFRFHDLRHTAASYLAMNGASLAEIAEILGHRTLQMTKRYAHLSETHKTKVLESMNSRMFG